MFSRLFSEQRIPPALISRPFDEPIRIDEARMHAWATALGQGAAAPVRPSRRSDLPDVDFSRAVPVPRPPGPVVRLMKWLLRTRRNIAAESSDAPDPALPHLRGPVPVSDGVAPDAEPMSRDHAA